MVSALKHTIIIEQHGDRFAGWFVDEYDETFQAENSVEELIGRLVIASASRLKVEFIKQTQENGNQKRQSITPSAKGYI